MLNGSYTNQQFLDFMLVATLKKADSERQTAGVFTVSLYLYILIELCMCHTYTLYTYRKGFGDCVSRFVY